MMDLERDLRHLMHRTADGLQHAPVATPGLVRRARAHRAWTAIVAGVAVLTLVVGGFAATRSLSNDQAIPPANPRSEGIFAEVQGWMAYGCDGSNPGCAEAAEADGSAISDLHEAGTWAVDPASPGDADDRVLLTPRGGEPVAWSSDGSKLLLVRSDGPEVAPDPTPPDLIVLNSDGSETRVPTDGTSVGEFAMTPEGSFSPDGSHVVYAGTDGSWPSRIYVVEVEGGTPELLLAPGSRLYPGDTDFLAGQPPSDRRFETSLYLPTFSPDGSQIAYFDGMGDWGHSLRVMNSDGTDIRIVVDNRVTRDGDHAWGLEWSRDSRYLAFAIGRHGVYTVGVDGSGLRLVAKDAVNPHWSPDGSRISYTHWVERNSLGLRIATLDTGQVQRLGFARSGPWNPLDR